MKYSNSELKEILSQELTEKQIKQVKSYISRNYSISDGAYTSTSDFPAVWVCSHEIKRTFAADGEMILQGITFDKYGNLLELWQNNNDEYYHKVVFCNLHIKAPYCVTMIDKFLSGWGMSKGRNNKMIVLCNDLLTAKTLQDKFESYPEMKRVNIVSEKATWGNNYPSIKYADVL